MRTAPLTAALFALAALLSWTGLHPVSNASTVLMREPVAKAPAGSQPSVVAVQTFGAWEVRCLKAPAAPAKAGPASKSPGGSTRVYAGVTIATSFPCRAVAESHINNNPLLEMRVVFLLVPQKSTIKVLAVFPPRFTLSALKGPRLKLGATVLQLRPYPRCDPLSCGAATEIPVARVAGIKNAKSVVLELPDLSATKPVEYTIPASGLSPAIEALEKLTVH